MVLPFEHRAKQNHSQSLERLARRGGLSPLELYNVIMDIDPWTDLVVEGDAEAMEIIKKWLAEQPAGTEYGKSSS